MSAPDLAAHELALGSLKEMLAADGYLMDISAPAAHELVIDVSAGPDACPDCLVPKEIMAGIAMDALGPASGVIRIDVHYPVEQQH